MVGVIVCATLAPYSTVLEASNVPIVGMVASCSNSLFVPEDATLKFIVPFMGLPLATVSVAPAVAATFITDPEVSVQDAEVVALDTILNDIPVSENKLEGACTPAPFVDVYQLVLLPKEPEPR